MANIQRISCKNHQEIVLSVTRPSITKVSLYTLTWSQNGVQQSRGVRQPIGIATSRVATTFLYLWLWALSEDNNNYWLQNEAFFRNFTCPSFSL